jgi:hypothetical protein
MSRWGLHVLALLGVPLIAGGCSNCVVGTRYASSFDHTDNFSDSWGLVVRPQTDWRVQLIGPPFLPLIPAKVHLSTPNEIELEVSLHVLEGRDFSLAWRPCLVIENAQPVCASSADLTWFALGGASVTSLAAFAGSQPWHEDFSNELDAERAGRLTRRALYEHIPYQGERAPSRFVLQARWVFPCVDTCPGRFVLDTGALAESEGARMTPGLVPFEREWVHTYDSVNR